MLAIAKEDWQDEESLQDAKRLTRLILAPLLGARPIYSRKLFMQRAKRMMITMKNNPILLGVNIDHVATLRQARMTRYPDPVEAVYAAENGGADGITVHLREDRRHIQERDVELIQQMYC